MLCPVSVIYVSRTGFYLILQINLLIVMREPAFFIYLFFFNFSINWAIVILSVLNEPAFYYISIIAIRVLIYDAYYTLSVLKEPALCNLFQFNKIISALP